MPRIAAWHDANDDKVYFTYKRQYSSDTKWREFNVSTGSWTSDPQLATSYPGSTPAGFAVNDFSISFYYNIWDGEYWFFQWIVKNKSDNSTISTCFSLPDLSYEQILYSTVTSDYNVHVPLWYNFAYLEEEYEPGIYHSNGYDCSLDEIYVDIDQLPQNVHFINCSSSSNDVYVTWQDDNNGQNLRMIYDDRAPLAPTNLTSYLDSNPSCNNCHGSGPGIRLDWTKNNEPDLFYYEIFRSEQAGCSSCHGSGSSSSSDSSSTATEPVTVSKECPALQGEITEFSSSRVEMETGCLSGLKSTQKITFEPIWAWNFNYWVDKDIQEDYTYFYFVQAKDVGGHESGQSNITNTYVPPGSFNKIFSNFSGEVVPQIYFLYQNYPNPFNPATKIHYQLPEDTYVKVEIYNSLGQLVKTLVNEFKPEGYYSVTWNGDDNFNQSLPSGIYLYKMTTQQYTDVKKMILLK